MADLCRPHQSPAIELRWTTNLVEAGVIGRGPPGDSVAPGKVWDRTWVIMSSPLEPQFGNRSRSQGTRSAPRRPTSSTATHHPRAAGTTPPTPPPGHRPGPTTSPTKPLCRPLRTSCPPRDGPPGEPPRAPQSPRRPFDTGHPHQPRPTTSGPVSRETHPKRPLTHEPGPGPTLDTRRSMGAVAPWPRCPLPCLGYPPLHGRT